MNRSVFVYAGILVLALGGAWMEYTSESTQPKSGVVVADNKKEELEKLVYTAPDIEVAYEIRKDDVGSYGWVTVTEQKKKKENGQDVPYTKVTKFKAGSAGDKVIESVAPVMALRDLDKPDDAKIESFGLNTSDSTFAVTAGGRTTSLALGGETYGTKDRYARDSTSGKVYVIDDELIKPMKFASSRLPERGLYSFKKEEIDSVTLGQGGTTVTWTQKNKDDKTAAFWDRPSASATAPAANPDAVPSGNPAAQTGGKDETFSNWFDSFTKVKSTAYVQEGEEPKDPLVQFELTLRGAGKHEETVTFLKSGDDWYAKSDFTRGLVKLSKTSAEDNASEVDDILEGRIPPEKAKPAKPASPHSSGPPGMAPTGPGNEPPHAPLPGRPGGMPGRPGGAPPSP